MRFLNDNEMGVRIGQLLTEYGYTLSSAESCTGGTIATMVTAVSGSSAYFKGAVVSYAVSVKEQVLGVDVSDGVVSESTALQMAEGGDEERDEDVERDGVAQHTLCRAVVLLPQADAHHGTRPHAYHGTEGSPQVHEGHGGTQSGDGIRTHTTADEEAVHVVQE